MGGRWGVPPPTFRPDPTPLPNCGNPPTPAAHDGSSTRSSGHTAAQMDTVLMIESGGRGTSPPPFYFPEGVHPPPCMRGGGGYSPCLTRAGDTGFTGFPTGKCHEEWARRQGGWGYRPPSGFLGGGNPPFAPPVPRGRTGRNCDAVEITHPGNC
jgi:hypothetical protein